MLTQILNEINTSSEPVSLTALSHKLGIERSALEGMLDYWVRKGRLRDDDAEAEKHNIVCQTGACGSSCAGPAHCVYVAKIPRTYSLRIQTKDENIFFKEK